MESNFDPTGKFRLKDHRECNGYMKCNAFSFIDNKNYTGRCVQRKTVTSSHMFEKLNAELETLQSISHPYIQKFIEASYNAQVYYHFVELEDVNLLKYYERDFPLTEETARVVFNYLIEAVAYLHKNGIVHLDIRPENIFIVDGKFKLGGFFNAKFVSEGEATSGFYGSLNYQAPEVFTSKIFDGKKADIWACGILLQALLTGKLPYDCNRKDIDNAHTVRKKIKTKISKKEIKFEPYLSDEAIDLLKLMLDKFPLNRATIEQIRNHPWLQNPKLNDGTLVPPITLEVDNKQ